MNDGGGRHWPVTVVALCYNHERFLMECLESIRAQTFQDFQLIVTDDCSRDRSPELIEAWLAQHRPDALFIRHERNRGLCATLNEALSHAQGAFLSMIATDDLWEPEKIERQLEFMRSLAEDVAVVYSDAHQMDESGQLLPLDFIQDHRKGFAPPSGRVFSHLVDGNFIPAMCTLIRRSAVVAAGGYDERLSYEDYDMWLRLSSRHEFAFLPGVLARYRIVGTSIVRTVFATPTARHAYTQYLIHERWLRSGLLNPEQTRTWRHKLWQAAWSLYAHGHERAGAALRRTFLHTFKLKALLLAVSVSLGLSRERTQRLKAMFGLGGGR